MTIRFIHTSDWQLGMTRAFLSAEASARFSQDRIDAISTLGNLAREHEAQFIIVAGDVFESNQLSLETVSRALNALNRLPVPVFLLPGNHDPLNAASVFNTKEFRAAADHVIVIRDMAPIAVPGLEGVEVVGAPWTSKRPTADLCVTLADSLAPSETALRIAVCHGQVDTLSPDKDRPEIIDLRAAEAAIDAGKFHYLGLGDRHSVTVAGDSGRVHYSGAPVATDFRETDPNMALLVEIDEKSCKVEQLSVGNWTFHSRNFEMNGQDDLTRFKGWLGNIADPARTIVKVSFKGTVNLATAADLDETLQSNAGLFASLRKRDRLTELAIAPDELDEDSVSLSGYAKQTWDELLADASANDETARDALMLLYRLSHRGT